MQGVNAVAEVSMGDPNQPLGKLIKVLNNQLQALTHLDARTDQLAAKVDAVTSTGAPLSAVTVPLLIPCRGTHGGVMAVTSTGLCLQIAWSLAICASSFATT